MSEAIRCRLLVRNSLDDVVESLNHRLRGGQANDVRAIVTRLGQGGREPHWFEQLSRDGALPNLDGKSIGSVLEMLFVAELELGPLANDSILPLKVNPARGVDLPDLELGVKSPSENYCTSEPYFSAYERLIGSAHDCVVLLTDYQTAKRQRPLRLQVLQSRYLEGSQLADKNLCEIARAIRPWLLGHGEDRAKRAFKFLAHINQSDWLAKKLLLLVHEISSAEASIDAIIDSAALDFARSNMRLQREDKPLIPDESLRNLLAIKEVNPRYIGILDQTENWMTDAWGEAGRSPNDREWREMLDGPLNGVIGMSFALQWRYNFRSCFAGVDVADEDE